MKPEVSFKEYYTGRNHFKNADYVKHNYANDVIEKLIECKPVGTTSDGVAIQLEFNSKIYNNIVNNLVSEKNKDKFSDFIVDEKIVLNKDNIARFFKKLKDLNLLPKNVNEFNTVFKEAFKNDRPWTKIFKGTFSGYINEASSKNNGNAFEVQLFKALGGAEGTKESTPLNPTNPKIANGLVKGFTGIDGPWGETSDISKTNTQFIGDKTAVKLTGGANNSRPIKFKGDQPVATISSKKGDAVEDTLNTSAGKTIADIVMIDKNGEEYYISAKYGKTVSFGNLGIRTNLFPKKWFETGKDEDLPKDGSELLTIFGINKEKFRNIFIEYENKHKEIRGKNDPNLSLRGNGLSNVYAEFDVSDINKKIKTKPKITSNKTTNEVESVDKNKCKIADSDKYYVSDPNYEKIINFIKSYIGFGYLLVHKSESGDITYTNLMEKRDRDNLLGSIKSYTIRYPDNSKSLSAKRLDIEIEFSNLSFEFNIRPTNGTIFPTRIDGTYAITNSAFKNKVNNK